MPSSIKTNLPDDYDATPNSEVRRNFTAAASDLGLLGLAGNETLSAAGPLSLGTYSSSISMSGDTNLTFTLADGVEGQRKAVVLIAKSGTGNAVITPDTAWLTGSVTLSAVGTSVEFIFVNGKWALVDGKALSESGTALSNTNLLGMGDTEFRTNPSGNLSVSSSLSVVGITLSTDVNVALPGGAAGQRKVILLQSKSSTGNLIVTPNSLWGGTTLTFSQAGHAYELVMIHTGWAPVGGTAILA